MKVISLINCLAALVILFASCSKSNVKSSAVASPPVVAPIPNALPNTVDKTDTLNIMAYNVLSYGDNCQGTTKALNGYFQTIIQYTKPDILSCEKLLTYPVTSSLPTNLGDDIRDSVLNTVFPGRYAYATATNASGGDKMSILFYNAQKLTFVKTETLVAYITDFDMYKLYYNDPNLAITHDTTFLYIVVNHTKSGSPSTTRDMQVGEEMQNLRAKFAYFPNMINMGDFNTANSYEPGYQSIITSADTLTSMTDPPFYPDRAEKYPAEWENNAAAFSKFLTTTTRSSISAPNSCGTGGGAKGWYDHIFISRWLYNGTNYMQYVPNSYVTVGNDGNRMGVDVNSVTPVVNSSAPAAVLNALYRFSDKYPVTIKLLVKANRNAYSIADPAERN